MNIRDQRIVVVGSGGGSLTIAAELGLAGCPAIIADQPAFGAGLGAVERQGGVRVQFRASPADDEAPTVHAPVAGVSLDPAGAVRDADVVVVCVPSYGHRPVAELLAPAWRPGQVVMFVGEGGGALTAVAALRAHGRVDTIFAETNSLPYGGAFIKEPGYVGATRKRGGTVIAALPAKWGKDVHALAAQIWPWISPAENVWESVLLNFNAIDHVPAMVCNLGAIERDGGGTYPIWGAGGTPGVVNVIAAVDREYLDLRRALGLANDTPYEDYLVEQGMAPAKGATLYDTIQHSILATVQFPVSPNALGHRFVAEDVPYSLVLAASLGDELGVDTPVIDGLIAVAAAAAGRDYRAEGRTVADWGLAGVGLAGLRAAAEEGWW
jgi:opine dehydrogenase